MHRKGGRPDILRDVLLEMTQAERLSLLLKFARLHPHRSRHFNARTGRWVRRIAAA